MVSDNEKITRVDIEQTMKTAYIDYAMSVIVARALPDVRDGFTNMLTPTSGVLIGVLGIARIPYGTWLKWVWKFILGLIVVGFLLMLPTLWLTLPGF